MDEERLQHGFHMMVNTSLLNLALFISDMAIPIYIISQPTNGTFTDVGWSSAVSFLLSGIGAILFGNLGESYGFGLIRFAVNLCILTLYVTLISSTNLVIILVIYVLRGFFMQNVWVSFAYYGKEHHPPDALWFIGTTLTLMYGAQVIGPLVAGLLLIASSARVTLIVTMGVFGLVFFQSFNFAKCPGNDDTRVDRLTVDDSSGRIRGSIPSAETYMVDDDDIESGTGGGRHSTDGRGASSTNPQSFFDLTMARQLIILFLILASAAGTIMTVILMTFYVAYVEFVLREPIMLAAAQISVFSLMAAGVSKYLPPLYSRVVSVNEESIFFSLTNLSRGLIFIAAICQIIICEEMGSVVVKASVVPGVAAPGTTRINSPTFWIGMIFLGFFQGIMYVVPSALLSAYAPTSAPYSSFVKGTSAFLKRSCTAIGLFFVGAFMLDPATNGIVLFYVLEISLGFAPVAVFVMYVCDCFDERMGGAVVGVGDDGQFGGADDGYERVPTRESKSNGERN